jgi:hypothetical protein
MKMTNNYGGYEEKMRQYMKQSFILVGTTYHKITLGKLKYIKINRDKGIFNDRDPTVRRLSIKALKTVINTAFKKNLMGSIMVIDNVLKPYKMIHYMLISFNDN